MFCVMNYGMELYIYAGYFLELYFTFNIAQVQVDVYFTLKRGDKKIRITQLVDVIAGVQSYLLFGQVKKDYEWCL